MVCAGLMMGLGFHGPSAAAREGKRCDAPTDMVIAYGDVIQCAISAPGEQDVFRLVGGAGQTIRVQIADRARGAARPCFQVRDPDDAPVTRRVCGNRERDLRLERSGIYRILVTEDAADGAETAQYTLATDQIDPTSPAAVPLKYGQQITDEINRRGDLDVYFFQAAANDTVAIRIADRTPGAAAPCFRLYDPAGEALTNRRCGNRDEEFLLATAGRHSILVTERPSRGQQEVEYRLRLSCVSGSCPSLGLDDVLTCLAIGGAPFTDGLARFTQPDEARKTDATDVRGCARFLPVPGKRFQFTIEKAAS